MTWVVIVRGIDAPAADVVDAVGRIKAGLGVPFTGTVTIREWLFDEAAGRKSVTWEDGLQAQMLADLEVSRPREAVCVGCGVSFSYRYTTGRPRKFCSDRCRVAWRALRAA